MGFDRRAYARPQISGVSWAKNTSNLRNSRNLDLILIKTGAANHLYYIIKDRPQLDLWFLYTINNMKNSIDRAMNL